jgi:hypothetical protein
MSSELEGKPAAKAAYTFRGRPCRINRTVPPRWANGYRRSYLIDFLDELKPETRWVTEEEWAKGSNKM